MSTQNKSQTGPVQPEPIPLDVKQRDVEVHGNLCRHSPRIWKTGLLPPCASRLSPSPPLVLTRDRELCLDGGRNCLTFVGVSFSMEWRLCGGCLLSGWGVDEMGKNFGGSKDLTK